MEYYIVKKEKIDPKIVDVNAYRSLGDDLILNEVAFALLVPNGDTLHEYAEKIGATLCENEKQTFEFINNYGK